MFDDLNAKSAEEPLTVLREDLIPIDRENAIFEYLLNKRRKYDGNTLVQLAVKLESVEALEYFLNNPTRWTVDLKAKNKDG